ncbi:MAG: FAD-dependent oxidoreductase [Lachnospiraceae bacterium]|nr:FAD-dependent oxidoreductase [Lachnospiraceae bacterium]
MKKIVIVGGGIAGLTAGIYARKSGFEVDLFEKNHAAGGQCIGWNRKNHHIDNCIHWLTGTKQGTELRKLWEEIGALSPEMKFVENDKFYTSYCGDQSVTLWRDLERTKRELLYLSPEDEFEINQLMEYVKYAVCCEMPVKKPMDMMNLFDYIHLGKAMGDMPKVIKMYGKVSVKDMADKFKHPMLKALFKDYLPQDYQASSFVVSYATIVAGNGNIPVGGSLAMTQRIVKNSKRWAESYIVTVR